MKQTVQALCFIKGIVVAIGFSIAYGYGRTCVIGLHALFNKGYQALVLFR